MVSPLRRALLTCDIIFKDHPSKPQVFVEPLLTEKIHSASNFGTAICESMLKYPHFNFDKLNGVENDWYVHLLSEKKR